VRLTERFTARGVAVRFIRRIETRFPVGGFDKRIECGVDRVDAGEVCLDDLATGHGPIGHQTHQFVSRLVAQVGHVGSSRN
jgi:hypothetical protein